MHSINVLLTYLKYWQTICQKVGECICRCSESVKDNSRAVMWCVQELDQRYNALLQMYGEKVEEAEELRLDLQDVKEMYKSQVCVS